MPHRNKARIPLSLVTPGETVILETLGNEIDPLQSAQLIAYGLAEGRPIRVLQQRPMTVILADEVELAFEHQVARHIWVEKRKTP